LKLLIGGSPSKIFHLKEFERVLIKLGIECKLVIDTDICNGFPSRKISDWFQTQKKFNKLISDFKPDVILVDRQRHFAKIALKYKIPLIIHLRGNIWKEIKWAKETTYKSFLKKIALNVWISIAKETFDKSFLIIPICKHLEKIVNERYPDKKTSVMYQGINLSEWESVKGKNLKHPCVGLLQGATIWGKAQEMLILSEVLKAKPDVMFYWAGDGQYRDKILQKLDKFDNFEWLGTLEYPQEVQEFLTEIDVYALISGQDMSPHTLLEAGLMKKPIIATDVGGVSESIINERSGFLVDQGNTKEIIKKISQILENKNKANEMGEKGYQFVKDNFSWVEIAKKFMLDMKKELI